MRELSKVEMTEVSGAGFLSDLLGTVTKDMVTVGDTIIGSITNGFVQTGKVFTDFVFNTVKGFWEGRFTK